MRRRNELVGALALAAFVAAWWATRFGESAPHAALDVLLYFLPSYATIAAHFRHGVIPLWNPYQLCGLPWIGTLQGGVFYPPHVLYVVLPLHQAFALSGVLHLLVIALATAAFARRLGLGSAAAFLAAVVFTLRGTVGTAAPAPNFLEAITWLPVGAVALVDLVRAPGGRSIALLGCATGLSFLAGYPQPTVYIVYTWGSLFMALLIHERPSLAGFATRVGALATALSLGGLFAAVQMLPALELMRSGTRATEGLTDLTMQAWTTSATPILLRHTIAGTPFALGLIALALAPAAVLAPGRRVIGAWALAVTALSAAWARGRLTPLFDLYLALPALRLFRDPGRLLFVTDFAVAIAAALGLSAVVGRPDPDPSQAQGWRRIAPIALVALALAAVLELVRRGWAPAGGQLVVTFALVSVVAIVALLWASASWRPVIGAAIAVAAAIEIASNPGSEFHLPYSAADLAPYEIIATELRLMAQLAGHNRVWRALPGIQIHHALKLSTWHRLRTINDYEPVNLQRQADFFTYFSDGSTTAKRVPWLFTGDIATLDPPPGGTPAGTRRRLLDLAAVRYVLFGHLALLVPSIRTFVAQAGLVHRVTTENVILFENPQALPRAFVTYRVRSAPADPDALLGMMSRPTFDPLAESFVEGPPPFVAAADAPARGQPAAFVRDDETDVELEVTLERPGLVVLADSFYPGWHATVNGAAAPIVPTNLLFRGVPAPAGTHRVRLVYDPASVRFGGLLSSIGLGGLAWLALGGGTRVTAPRGGSPATPGAAGRVMAESPERALPH
jgi:hypothetical protein